MRSYDLIVLGAGSGNMLLGPETAHWKTAIVEPWVFGGTCLNRGCIPSKMFILPADAVETARHAHRLGVSASVQSVDWLAIRDRIFGRIDPIAPSGRAWRIENGIDVFDTAARFVAPKVLEIDGEQITGERIVVAVGARPVIPEIPGIEDVTAHTSDSVMRLDVLPATMLVLGGGFIAVELAHVFEAYGVDVTIVQRSARLLTAEDTEIGEAFTAVARGRFHLHTSSKVLSIEPTASGGVRARVQTPDGEIDVEAEVLLVAAGRTPNSDTLDAAAGGLAVDDKGVIVVDQHLRTTADGVWAFGDVASQHQLKHMANAQGRVLKHNLLHPDDLRVDPNRIIPHAVFAEPQIAAVGITEREAIAGCIPHVISKKAYSDVAYGWALEDTTGFVKLIADPATRLLLGAHIIGPQAATLIQQLIQGMTLGQTVEQMAQVIYIHPALTEVVENALLDVPTG